MCACLVFKLRHGLSLDLLFAIVFAGVGVGLAEELLFRGVVLRILRTNSRSEAWAMLRCSLWFGMMHAINVLLGSPAFAIGMPVIGMAGRSLGR